jgi:class 3 adenylate cyclase/tetratricopeptide (TPR) repeat protein/TolB-like protein
MMEPERSLATVLFTDIVGSTERASELGDREWRALLKKHHAVVRRKLRRYRGREGATTGDGFLAVFDRPERAIACACAIRDALHELGLEVRAGLHLGGVEVIEKTVGGIAVHIANRVAAQAGAGEVLVSSTVHDAVEGSGFGFEDRGLHTLKGVRGEWRLYVVTSLPARADELFRVPWLPRFAAGRSILLGAAAFVMLFIVAGLYIGVCDGDLNGPPGGPGDPPPPGPGIAVLPFSVNDASLDRLREAMVDLLSTNLDGAGGLRAIDTRTVLACWREEVDDSQAPDFRTKAMEVARCTDARYALVGSMVSSGPGIRITANVYDAPGGVGLGAVQVEGSSSPDSVFTLADRLSVKVLTILNRGDPPKEPPTESPTAYKAYLEGEALFRRSDFKGAIAAYNRAVDADSTFALALYRLADAQGWKEDLWSDVTSPYLERAARFADRLPEREELLLRAGLTLGQGRLEGIELARQAVKRYPDEPEAWYLLGDAFYHLGAQALIGQGVSDQPLSRAVKLDPSLTPAYIHLIHNAFYGADSARAADLVERYGRFAGGSEFDHANRLAFELAFSEARAGVPARAVLDTLEVRTLEPLAKNLTHPRFRPMQEEVFNAVRRRFDTSEGPLATVALCWNHLLRGKMHALLADLDDPLMPAWFRTKCLYSASFVGMPVPVERLERELALGKDGAPPDLKEFYAGAYAADRGRWADHATVQARMEKAAEEARTGGDSTAVRLFEGAAQALDGYALWRRGNPDRAFPLLEAAQKRATGIGLVEANVNEQIRLWLGKLCLETGRHQEAETYFNSFFSSFGLDFLAAYELARMHAELGEDEKARRDYEFFIEAWRDADPELQPMVEEARRAAARLGTAR